MYVGLALGQIAAFLAMPTVFSLCFVIVSMVALHARAPKRLIYASPLGNHIFATPGHAPYGSVRNYCGVVSVVSGSTQLEKKAVTSSKHHGMKIMLIDNLVLALSWWRAGNTLRSARKSDIAWNIGGAILLFAYGAAGVQAAVLAAAAHQPQLDRWMETGAIILASGGLIIGFALSGFALAQANKPFLRALPISFGARRRQALIATFVMGFPFAIAFGMAAGGIAALIRVHGPTFLGGAAAMIFGTGFILSSSLRLTSYSEGDRLGTVRYHWTKISVPGLVGLDSATPKWLGAWAWTQPAGSVWVTTRLAALILVLAVITVIAAETSLVHRQAAPALFIATAEGVIIFMLSLRYHPFGSPVLRTAPQHFTWIWLRHLRLPFALSALGFVLPASAAVVAEPSSWQIAVTAGLWLTFLNGIYAVFAAYFLYAPLVAALSFVAAIAFAAYEYLEYGGATVLAMTVLVAWLWYRTRRRYLYG